MSLFNQGWKAETSFGDDVTALHMNTRSVYRFKENSDFAITHSAKYIESGNVLSSVDQFALTFTEVTAYHDSGNVLSQVTKTLGVYDTWLEAFDDAIDLILQKSGKIKAPSGQTFDDRLKE